MLSVIAKREELGNLLKQFSEVLEVYADVDFDFYKEGGTFVVLTRCNLDSTSGFYYKFQSLFELPVKVYITQNCYSGLFQRKRIIWRLGRWYI